MVTKKYDININCDRILNIQKEVLKKIKPTKSIRNRLEKTSKTLFRKVEIIIKNKNIDFDIEPILVGSIAKDTFLLEPDIDLFIMFPQNVPVQKLRELGLRLAKEILPTGEERYAEHPYIAGKFEGFDIDIVPCYKLSNISEKMTAVDRTPFHTTFIKDNLAHEQRDEVRLLKQFMKGIGVYGAEIAVQGFSGYLCELLILKYGTMLSLLQNTKDWEPGLVLDIGADDTNRNSKRCERKTRIDLPRILQNKFKDEPLIFIDPVDMKRNVASAVADDKFELFITAAKEFLAGPKIEFFFPNPIIPLQEDVLKDKIHMHPNTIIGLEFPMPNIIPDILFGQVRKCQRAVQKLLIKAGFDVANSDFYVNNRLLILYELTSNQLPEVETHTGPPEGHENVNDFLTKWEGTKEVVNKPYIKDNRWYVDHQRSFRTAQELIRAKIGELNLGKQLNMEIKSELNIYQDIELLNSGFNGALTRFLDRKKPWEY